MRRLKTYKLHEGGEPHKHPHDPPKKDYTKLMPWMSEEDIKLISNINSNATTVKRQLVFGEPGFKEQQRYLNEQRGKLLSPSHQLKLRLRDSITPIGYDVKHATKEFIAGERLPFTWDGQQTTFDDFDKLDRWKNPETGEMGWYGKYVKDASKDAWNMYLGFDQENDTYKSSFYQPSNSKNTNAKYYSLNYDDDIWDEAINNKVLNLKKGQSKYIKDSSTGGFTLQNYKLGKGYDNELKLPYISYYDKNDYNIDLGAFGNIKGEDIVGEAFEVYGRMYYDPKTKKRVFPEPKMNKKEGGFIEIELTDEEAEKYRDGGYILEELENGGEDSDPPFGPKSKEEREKLYNYSTDQEAPNMILTYKDDKKFIDGISNWQTISSVPINDKFSDQIKARLYTGNYGYNPATGTLYNLNKLSGGKSKTSTIKDPDVLAYKKDLDATAGKSDKEVAQYYQNKEDALAEKYDKEWKSNRHPVLIDRADAWNPAFILKDKYGREYNTQKFAGQSVLMTDEEEAAYRKAMIQHNAPIAQQQMNTLFSIPASFTPAGLAVMGMHGAANLALKSGPEFVENPSWSNAGSAGLDLLMASPVVIPAGISAVKGVNNLRNVKLPYPKMDPNKLGSNPVTKEPLRLTTSMKADVKALPNRNIKYIPEESLPFEQSDLSSQFQNKNIAAIFGDEAKAAKTSNLPKQSISKNLLKYDDQSKVISKSDKLESFKQQQDDLSQFALDFNTIWMEGDLSNKTKRITGDLQKLLKEQEQLNKTGADAFYEARKIKSASEWKVYDYETKVFSPLEGGYIPSDAVIEAEKMIEQLKSEMEAVKSLKRKKHYKDAIGKLEKHVVEYKNDIPKGLVKSKVGNLNIVPDDSWFLKDNSKSFRTLKEDIAKARTDVNTQKLATNYDNRAMPLQTEISKAAREVDIFNILEPDVRARIQRLRQTYDTPLTDRDIISSLETRGTLGKTNSKGYKTSSLIEGKAGDPSLKGTHVESASQEALNAISGQANTNSYSAVTKRGYPLKIRVEDAVKEYRPQVRGTDDEIERIYEVWSKGENPVLEGHVTYTRGAYENPKAVAGTVGHEDRHIYQNIMGYLEPYTEVVDEFGYYTSNLDTKTGKLLYQVMKDPTPAAQAPSGRSHTFETWLSSPKEVDANLAAERIKVAWNKYTKAKQAKPNSTREELIKDIVKEMKLPENRKKFIEELMTSPEGNAVKQHFKSKFTGAINAADDAQSVTQRKEFIRDFLEALPIFIIGLGLESSMSNDEGSSGKIKREGGSIEAALGDIVDEATMKRLKKLGYTLKEV